MGTKNPGTGFCSDNVSNTFKNVGDSMQVGRSGNDHCADTILRLQPIGSDVPHLPMSRGMKRKWSCRDGNMGLYADPSLSLGLHRSSSSSDSKGSSATACTAISSAKETDAESSMDLDLDFTLHLGSDQSPSPKIPAVSNFKKMGSQLNLDLELSLSTSPPQSDITSFLGGLGAPQHGVAPLGVRATQFADNESASSLWNVENSSSPVSLSPAPVGSSMLKPIPRKADLISITQDASASTLSVPNSSVTCTSGFMQPQQPQRGSSSKLCQFIGCGKGARGASGLCIAHGGGRRCQRPGCSKGAEGRTALCKAHGGGRRCEFLGCTKSAEGRTDFCIAHGGGRRCGHDGCSRAARGKSGLCIRHGGGKRCQRENCTRSAEGLSGLCISHGGGRRCQFLDCNKGAQGSTMFCKAHGGGKRCTIDGCTKGAEGSTPYCKGHGGGKRCSFPDCPKSVHGGTAFCVAHGGGKRCAVTGCTKSARGRTDFCVRHGGGKRCRIDGCGKSAQGSTDFCKAHGGGKKCAWGQLGSPFGNQADGPCDSLARGKTGLCSMHSALVQDKRVHGGITLGPLLQDPDPTHLEKIIDVSVGVMGVDPVEMGSTGLNVGRWSRNMMHSQLPDLEKESSLSPPTPEGRVHGGSLMSLLASS
ncbi:putative WRKY transcription factor 19 [Bienertia sinuspersici]